jgi:pimeloyl-ACP methyl ester carboxylesterase
MRRVAIWSLSAALAAAGALGADPVLRIESTTFKAGGEEVAAEIGRFSVPENRAKRGGRTIELAFIRFKSTSQNPGAPIVYLAGGPGGSGTGTARGTRFPLFLAMREFGDVIAFDQRGTGLSEPDLSCPDRYSMPLDRVLPREAREPMVVAAASACAESLRARGHDLSAYNTAESADDIEDLRRALGAEKLTLWGISYGTHLALAAMKRHPESFHRVILAGLEGLHHTYKLPSDQQALIETIGRLAAADPVVGKVAPDLPGSIRRLLARLQREPVTVDMTDPTTGRAGSFVIGPFDLQLVLAGLLAGPESFAAMPDLIVRLEQGDWTALALVAAGDRLGRSVGGMSLAMDCASGMSREWAARIAREAKSTLLGDAINWPSPDLCAGVGVPDLGDKFRAPVRSSIPALLISGTLDGRTPPSNAEEVLPGLARAQHLIIEGAGHSDPLFLSSPKILEAMQAFMRGETLPATHITLDPVRFQAPRKVATVPAAVLDRLVGSYKLGPMDVRVVRGGSLLFVIVHGRPAPLRPLSETEFFVESRPSRVRFVAKEDGKIARMEYLEIEGADWLTAERVE